jgi:nitrite reductase/ring-hydroxylating ferredoxin subunit
VTNYLVGRLDEFAEGGRKVVSCDGVEIGVFMVDGTLYAWYNNCAHMRGPICQGRIYKRVVEPVADDHTTRMLDFSQEHTHIVCPWHGYEFDLKTGQHPGSARHRLRKAKLEITDGEVYVVL